MTYHANPRLPASRRTHFLFVLALSWLAPGLGCVRDAGAAAEEPEAGLEIVHPVDGAMMVWVPSGRFIMGIDREEAQAYAKGLGYDDYHAIAAQEWMPKSTPFVDGFFIDKYEVTNERWSRFTGASGYVPPERWQAKAPPSDNPGDYALYPVTRVLWEEAQKYAGWASKSLPRETQWEKAARGTDGRMYPWGNEPLSEDRGVFVDLTGTRKAHTPYRMVGSKPAGASPYGCMDMAGNVYEWTSEWLEPYPNNPERESMSSYTGHQNGCLRGGSFYHAVHAYACAKRFGFKPDETYYHVGFRTVWTPPIGFFESDAFKKAQSGVAARKAELATLREKGKPSVPVHY